MTEAEEREEKTVGQVIAEELIKIREALEKLEAAGFRDEIIELYVAKKARVNITTARTVIQAYKNFLKEMNKPFKRG